MKRFFSVLLTFVFLFACASCRNNEAHQVTDTTPSSLNTVKDVFFIETSVASTDNNKSKTLCNTKTVIQSKIVTSLKTTVSEYISTVKATMAEKSTKPATSQKALTELTTVSKQTCSISIDCSSILNNMSKLKSGKEHFIPLDGSILKTVTVEFEQGSTVFDILKDICSSSVCSDNCRYCQSNGIQLEYIYTPGYDNYYIEGIHQIYEKDCGSKSGWMYKVNGLFPNEGCSSFEVNDGDRIEFVYTCDLGEDIGN